MVSRHLSSPVGLAAMVVRLAATHIRERPRQRIRTPSTIRNRTMLTRTHTRTLPTRCVPRSG
jgi:hypothetical protein